MSVFDVIKHRHSIGKMTEQVPTQEQIERLLEAATYAPNHHKVEPWRFFVLAGEARNQLGEVMANSLSKRLDDILDVNLEPEKAQAILDKERKKLLRAPVIIVVTSEYPTLHNVVDIENVEATAAAVENMILVAQEMGLAYIWRTGDAAYDNSVKHWLGLSAQDTIVSILYVGYPAITPPKREVTPFSEKTTWLGWGE